MIALKAMQASNSFSHKSSAIKSFENVTDKAHDLLTLWNRWAHKGHFPKAGQFEAWELSSAVSTSDLLAGWTIKHMSK